MKRTTQEHTIQADFARAKLESLIEDVNLRISSGKNTEDIRDRLAKMLPIKLQDDAKIEDYFEAFVDEATARFNAMICGRNPIGNAHRAIDKMRNELLPGHIDQPIHEKVSKAIESASHEASSSLNYVLSSIDEMPDEDKAMAISLIVSTLRRERDRLMEIASPSMDSARLRCVADGTYFDDAWQLCISVKR